MEDIQYVLFHLDLIALFSSVNVSGRPSVHFNLNTIVGHFQGF
jgi:hypothetical protein